MPRLGRGFEAIPRTAPDDDVPLRVAVANQLAVASASGEPWPGAARHREAASTCRSRHADAMTVVLRPPVPADLPHRARWMSDPATMAYNAGYDLTHPGYHRDTGCIDFPAAEWAAWLQQADDDAAPGRRFHAMVEADAVVVGEAGFGVEHGAAHLHLVIEASCAGRGFGSAALALLLAEAFSRPEVTVVVDDFPASRASAERIFAARGFVRDGDRVVLARGRGNFHP